MFCLSTDRQDLFIGKAVQKAYLEVTEEGAEGAAGSGDVLTIITFSLGHLLHFELKRSFQALSFTFRAPLLSSLSFFVLSVLEERFLTAVKCFVNLEHSLILKRPLLFHTCLFNSGLWEVNSVITVLLTLLWHTCLSALSHYRVPFCRHDCIDEDAGAVPTGHGGPPLLLRHQKQKNRCMPSSKTYLYTTDQTPAVRRLIPTEINVLCT